MSEKHDAMFMEVLKENKNVDSFLDAFFGFLHRCTDFYIESEPDGKLGFPPGVAQKLITNKFQKWKNETSCNLIKPPVIENPENVPMAIQEIQVQEENRDENSVASIQASEYYNGDMCDDYSWSQSISDVDVLVNVPPCITSAKDLRVEIKSEEIAIQANKNILESNGVDTQKFEKEESSGGSDWITIFRGRLSFKIRKDESLWSLVRSQYVSIHLEKTQERWWDSLLVDGPKIELSRVDCSRDLGDLGDTEQMKIQEVMWNHQQKLLGKPTSEQIKMEEILKKAWDTEGSPFKGTPYDPTVLKFD